MGSMNFGLFPMLNRFKEFKHDWERAHLEGSRDARLPQHLQGHRVHADAPCASNGTRFEFECYDIGHLYNLHHFLERGAGEAAALRADGVRHPRRHRPASRGRHAHEAHRRPAVRRPVPLVGARRRPQPDADRRHGRGDGRQCPRRARGLAVGRPGPAGRSPMPSRCICARKIIEGLGLEVATPDEAREILEPQGRATRSRSRARSTGCVSAACRNQNGA